MVDLDLTLHPIFLNDEDYKYVESEHTSDNVNDGKGLLNDTGSVKTKETNLSLGSIIQDTTKSSSSVSCNERTRVIKRMFLEDESRDDIAHVSAPSMGVPLTTVEEKKETNQCSQR